jgi:curved DNA-binding protein
LNYKDYYELMGVARDATQVQIKQAYRKLARKYHPDVSKEKDAEARFKELGEAYEVLKDPEKRAAYDQLGSGQQPGQEFHPPPDWGKGFEFRGNGASDDFFESLFGQRFQGADSGASRDHHAKLQVDLEASLEGAARSLKLRLPGYDAAGHLATKERTLNVKIPRGILAGQQIRLAGQGMPAQGRQPAGDLFIEVSFAPHRLYRVEGRDLFLDLPVAPWEAALGATVRVPTPEGSVDLRVPAGSQSGARLRLKGRGMPAREPGDLYAVLKIVLPPAESAAAKAAYAAFAEALPFDPRAGVGA